jgi:hypothetical protein
MPKQSLNENNRALIDQVIDEILAQIPVP